MGICLLIFLMVAIGSITRLTGSGLSMVDWHPATGLTAHLMLAVAIYSYILWVALGLLAEDRPATGYTMDIDKLTGKSLMLLVLVIITMVSGGFVAGLKAGLIYNTFPLMGDTLIAPGVYFLSPWYLSALEDAVTVQFNHRLLALTSVFLIVGFYFYSHKLELPSQTKNLLILVLFAGIVQVGLGISTLLLRVSVLLGASHQAGALILLSSLLLLHHHLKNTKPV